MFNTRRKKTKKKRKKKRRSIHIEFDYSMKKFLFTPRFFLVRFEEKRNEKKRKEKPKAICLIDQRFVN